MPGILFLAFFPLFLRILVFVSSFNDLFFCAFSIYVLYFLSGIVFVFSCFLVPILFFRFFPASVLKHGLTWCPAVS